MQPVNIEMTKDNYTTLQNTKQEIRSIERVSVQCVAFHMPKQAVMY